MDTKLPDFSQARILVVGDLMLDRYWYGPTGRISPEAPVPVVNIDHTEERPGGAANVALNLAALGAQVKLIGVTGQDAAATSLTKRLTAAGVDCIFQQLQHSPTITKLRVISRQQQLIRLDFEAELAVDTEAIEQALLEHIDSVDGVILSDYGKGVLANAQDLITLIKQHQRPVWVDPKNLDFSCYRGASLLTPNRQEFIAACGSFSDETELVSKAQHCVQRHQLEGILITRGEQGMTLVRTHQPELHLPARAREVYDVTGAGDTVIAVLAAALVTGTTLNYALILANLAASVVVSKLGTTPISLPELRRVLQREKGAERGIINLEQLQIAVHDARAQGEKIVFTNGCFDIIHAGHVQYLEQAKAQGQRLIVAVNDDAGVTRLKGEGRPINALERRMAVLAALESVDWVIAFNQDTPEELLGQLKPDLLVKGGDYQADQVIGRDIVQAYGGQVKVLSVVDQCSTSLIVERLQQPTTNH
jgi:D-beta-D-heptose 7-phosphate kinase/D-beta-D-heptose 1-phosphate adenosyltransferase